MTDKDKRKFLDNIIADAEPADTNLGPCAISPAAENPVAVGAAKTSASIKVCARLPFAQYSRER